jgi:mono/diheme cytochrome c family protein
MNTVDNLKAPAARVRSLAAWLVLAALGAVLAACSGGGNNTTDTVAVNGEIPIAYAKRSTSIGMNPTNGAPYAPGGDLMIREKSSPSARELNVTAPITQGQGDVSDPEVSWDGKKVVFALRCPSSNTSTVNGQPACTGRWNIWEYDTTPGLDRGTMRRITSSTTSDDVDPAYLPADRGFVFSSNRQGKTATVVNGQTFYAVDEYERERVFQLHVMDKDGGAIEQISVNQSHDRNPVVRPNGDIMFSRWEHVGVRNRFAIFKVKPDGTDMFVLYGAHSPGNSFLHPRDMDPNGPFKGQLISDLMPLSGTQQGGGLMLIDAARYSEANTPANASAPATGGQVQITAQQISLGRGLSQFGRITTPYPLWDSTSRVLLAYRPCEVVKSGIVVSCVTLSPAELALLNDDTRSRAQRAQDPVQDNAPAVYSIYMYDPARQTFLNVAAPPAGFMYIDPVALQPRAEPQTVPPAALDATLRTQNLGLIEVRSLYDTDGLDRMGDSMLVASDTAVGCASAIAKVAPLDSTDTRAMVADLRRMKDPADPAYGCQPARFVRATRAVAPQQGMLGMRQAIGETDFEPQQILGYAPVEPDGSFKLQVPADVPLALAILDAQGRAIQTHLNWIQVRPGERRTCDGCHSPRRGASINAGAVVNTLPASLNPTLAGQHQSGETLASTRTRLDPAALNLRSDPVFSDVWADTSKPGVTARPAIALRYSGNSNAQDDLATPAPSNGVINYADHVQPIWTRSRGANGVNTCTNCHADPAKLDLRANVAGSGRLISYERLLVGDPVIDPVSGQPVFRLDDGVPVLVRLPARVETDAGDGAGLTRKSRLAEVLFGETLRAAAETRTLYPAAGAGAPAHASLLNAAEKRLITEWIDLGGQYFNNVMASNSPVRSSAQLSESVFTAQVYPVLKQSCVGCHQPSGNAGAAQGSLSFLRNRFVLAGDAEGDYNVTLTMISSTCQPANNALLRRPSTVPHPAGAVGQTAAVLPVGSAGYNAIANWISAGCVAP